MTRRDVAIAAVAFTLGVVIAVVDASPRFDDTGVTAIALLVVAAGAAALSGRAPIAWALLVGLPLPVIEIARGGNVSTAMALAFPLVGALIGWLVTPRRRQQPVA